MDTQPQDLDAEVTEQPDLFEFSSDTQNPPAPSEKVTVAPDWEHAALHANVIEAIKALPIHFKSELNIEGVLATDLYTLNSPLSAAMESSMVETLNNLRNIWDADGRYKLYKFVRQAQVFPDVRLQKISDPSSVLMGIELKGWFVMSKEGEPSFRYRITEAACAPQDLLVVVPWMFKNVISGKPVLLTPVIESAKYVSRMRNHHWKHVRASKESKEIIISPHPSPYPLKTDRCSDKAVDDGGSNFGRIARCGLDEFNKKLSEVLKEDACGIPIESWISFLNSNRALQQ